MKRFEIEKVIAFFFVLYIFIMCLYTTADSIIENHISAEDITYYLENDIPLRGVYIDVYGYIQRILGKKQIEQFTIFKNSYDKLAKVNDLIPEYEIESKVDEVNKLFEYCNNMDIPYLYVNSILPISDTSDLPYKDIDHTIENAECLQHILDKKGINILDIRNNPNINNIPKESRFYKTDHHWTTVTSFVTFQEIIRTLNEQYGLDVNENLINDSNYSIKTYKDSFLGSYGVKVGEYYSGRDDFNIYIPKFKNVFSFKAYDADGVLIDEKEGEWFDCLMDQDILNNSNYENKYNAWSNMGYVENIIINNEADNDLKVLYISHSYGRPVSQYLAICFKEVRNIDPQEGRFSGNYLDYIDEYNPDIVIFQGEFEGQIIGNYITER